MDPSEMHFCLPQGDGARLILPSSEVVTASACTSQVYSSVAMETGSNEQEISF